MATTEAVLSLSTSLGTSATTQTETLETLTALIEAQNERLATLEEGVLELKRIRALFELVVEAEDNK